MRISDWSSDVCSSDLITINRGGINFTQGPDFSSIYSATGFCFTEQDDIDGTYAPGATPEDPNVEGDKPCYHIECPEFDEERLDVCSLCLTAGLLQARGHPEINARVRRAGRVARPHRLTPHREQKQQPATLGTK